uniref:sensor histidine kinase n=1 Tax=uncultured Pseudophaeobacter sp. TaxID=1759421 RepID=UPI0025E2F8B8
PVFDAARDMIGLGALLYLTVRVLIASYRMQRDEKRRELKCKIEEQLVAMRADALRQTSHEVRTPLSTITAISETLLDGSTGDLNVDQRDFVKDIDEAAHHLLALVNDILDYAKAEAGMIRLAPQPVTLAELVDQCVSMVTPRAQQAGVTVTAQVDAELNEVIADPLRLRQIMDQGEILIINLAKGQLGAATANVLGGMIVSNIMNAAFSRHDG